MILDNFLERNSFNSYEDFMQNYKVNVPENFNFAYDVVDRLAETQPDKEALIWTNDAGDEHRFTFADIKRHSDEAASFFTSLGIGHGDMVMLILKRHYQFWFAIMGLHKIGAITIPATHLLTPKDIIYRCNKGDIKAIVCAADPQIVAHIEAAAPECPSLKYLISAAGPAMEGWHDFDAGLASAAPWSRPEGVNTNDDISLLYFTSGTSGEPKMVAHNYLYPLGHIITARFWHNLTPGSLHLTVADTGWGKAVWGKLYGQWLCEATVFVYDFDKFVPANLLQKMQDYHITSFCAPPTIYRFMIQEDVTKYDLSALRYCTIAGEALNPAVFDEWYRLTGIKMMEGFGQTETTLTVANYPWMTPRPGSMGKPGPGYKIAIMGDDGSILGPGQEGEIVINIEQGKPLGLFSCYINEPGMYAKVCHDGYYHTGDVASMDEDGYLWFVGRKDDILKSSGYRISPFEVESALISHPAVVECAITGVPDAIRGQVVKATVVLSADYVDADREALTKELQHYVKEMTAPYKYPRIIEYVTMLPKTISGKIRHAEIRHNDARRAS